NLAKAIYEGQVLQIVVFSIIFGIAVAMIRDKYRAPMIKFTEALAETMFKFTQLIMYFAPFAVFAAIAYSTGHMGLEILYNLFKLLATLYVSLIVFLLVVLLPVALIFKVPVKKFIRSISEPVVLAFSTTSSEAALPIAMERMEEFGVPRKIVAFVMPTGYSFNLDGTTLYLSLATIFVAQISGIHLPIEKQLLIVFTLMLTSKGVAGVPRASLVILLATAASFELPVWPIYIILGIDELMDMARTSVNVIGNCLATVVIARWEGEFNPQPESKLFQKNT
ncbi:dicarboxylate/amino acid:cation symporter, partial [bacterium]|nr:dicarboxylate/amino acid:cation symporter [bacterium]